MATTGKRSTRSSGPAVIDAEDASRFGLTVHTGGPKRFKATSPSQLKEYVFDLVSDGNLSDVQKEWPLVFPDFMNRNLLEFPKLLFHIGERSDVASGNVAATDFFVGSILPAYQWEYHVSNYVMERIIEDESSSNLAWSLLSFGHVSNYGGVNNGKTFLKIFAGKYDEVVCQKVALKWLDVSIIKDIDPPTVEQLRVLKVPERFNIGMSSEIFLDFKKHLSDMECAKIADLERSAYERRIFEFYYFQPKQYGRPMDNFYVKRDDIYKFIEFVAASGDVKNATAMVAIRDRTAHFYDSDDYYLPRSAWPLRMSQELGISVEEASSFIATAQAGGDAHEHRFNKHHSWGPPPDF